MKTLLDVLSSASLNTPDMPIIHSTSLYNFRNILKQSKITSKKCPVFNENLLYYFYGKPSYRVATKSGARTDITYCPICFVLKPQCVSDFKRIYPFDSGAFHNGLYKAHLPKEFDLMTFHLGNDPEMPKRVVDLFFGSNRAYFFGDATRMNQLGPMDFEVQSYYQLITSSGETGYDDRRSSIELQSELNLTLSERSVCAIILPKKSLDDTDVFNAVIRRWKAIPITYNTFNGTKPSEYHGVIRELLSSFLEDHSYI